MLTEDELKIVEEFNKNFINNQKELEPEIQELINYNFWELFGDNEKGAK